MGKQNQIILKQGKRLRELFEKRWESTDAMLSYLSFCARNRLEAIRAGESMLVRKISDKKRKELLESIDLIATGKMFSSLAGVRRSYPGTESAYKKIGIRFYGSCIKSGLAVSSRRGTLCTIPLSASRKRTMKLCIAQWLGVKGKMNSWRKGFREKRRGKADIAYIRPFPGRKRKIPPHP